MRLKSYNFDLIFKNLSQLKFSNLYSKNRPILLPQNYNRKTTIFKKMFQILEAPGDDSDFILVYSADETLSAFEVLQLNN